MLPAKQKQVQRKPVPCECSKCGGVTHQEQEVRRSHLKKETELRARLAAAEAAPVNPPSGPSRLGEASTFPASEASTPAEQVNQSLVHDLPALWRPPSPLRIADPPGTPLSPSRSRALQLEEERTQGMMAAIVSQATQDEIGEPLMDDDWEAPDPSTDGEDEPEVPAGEQSEHTTSTSTIVPSQVLENVGYTSERTERPFAPETSSAAAAPSSLVPPVAFGVPQSKIDENDPDPFAQPGRSSAPRTPITSSEVHPQPGIYLLYVLVTWLHLQFHLPFRACSALIGVFVLILRSFGNTVDPPPITTLPRVMSRLQVEPVFNILPVCPSCLEVYPAADSTPLSCTLCHTSMFKAPPPIPYEKRSPLLQFPTQTIESQLEGFLNLPGIEKELEAWRKVSRTPGKYVDVFDGHIPQNLLGPDGEKFFRNNPEDLENGPDGELRIALTLGVDWFSYLRSQISPSHSSCPISFNVANLPPHLRYRTANLFLRGILPGPKEQNPDQCQRFFRLIVTELLKLWKDGVKIPTPSCPAGRLIRLILICICCDKPAAHKMGGFGSHSHTFFCTKCWIKQSDKESPDAYKKDAFRKRTDKEHRQAGADYVKCQNKAQRDDFVKHNAARWSEFARLPYFDFCRMIVIDPMHNLILGLVKTHFYHIWVQGKILRKTKELRAFHGFLQDFNMPPYLGRLPTLMGIPAGGSLTADQWLLMATVVGPIAVPQIWHDYMLDADEARAQRENKIHARIRKKKAAAERRKAKAAAKKAGGVPSSSTASAADVPPAPPGPRSSANPGRKRKKARSDANEAAGDNEEEEEEEDPVSCLHPDDPANFLKLCKALRILVAREITDAEIDEADALLREYCLELIELYGPDVMKPNHHYAIHTPECVRDFGPLHGFWTFLFERLNKVLKAYKTNNHSGGELETTFFREFHRTVLTSRLVARSSAPGQPAFFQEAVSMMFSASADDRGTVQALSRELDTVDEDAGVLFALSPRYEKKDLGVTLYYGMLRRLSTLFPHLQLRSHIQYQPDPQMVPLHPTAMFFDYAIIRQRRFYASNRANNNHSSLLEATVSERGETWAGELMDLIHINQGGGYVFTLGHFRWFKPLHMDVSQTIWNAFIPLGIKLWHQDVYLQDADPGPPSLLPLQYVKTHVARHAVVISDVAAWATISIGKNL